jgi:Zn finger protein HypA/HybF involved in hydrogenase expression
MALFHYGSSTPPAAALPHIALDRLAKDPEVGPAALHPLLHRVCPRCGQTPLSPSYARCRDCRRRRARAGGRLLEAVNRIREALRAQRAYARTLVNQAVQEGIITRPEYCPNCQDPESPDQTPPEAHHEDYNEPLKITWLCPKCHGERHSEMSKEEGRSLHLEVVHETVKLYGDRAARLVLRW